MGLCGVRHFSKKGRKNKGSPFLLPFLTLQINKKEKLDGVTTALRKVEEVVERFHIYIKKDWKVLDIGAAPGGWTSFFATQGVEKVIPHCVVH
jgi:predicted rRNA methylase YqxC with S4 and FtsJ domains